MSIKGYKICTGTTIEGLEKEVKEVMNSREAVLENNVEGREIVGDWGVYEWVPCGGITVSEKGVMFQVMVLEG